MNRLCPRARARGVLFVLVLGLASAGPVPACAETVFDTFPYLTGCGGYGITGPANIYSHSDNDVAVYVDVPAGTDYLLETVEVPLCRWRGSDIVHVYLMSDNGEWPSLPAAVLDSSLTYAPSETYEPGVVAAQFSGETVLAAGTRYWVACSSPADAYTAWAQGEDNEGFFAGRTDLGSWLQNHSTLMPAVRVLGSPATTDIGPAGPARAVVLLQNHPNPFNPSATIRYELSRHAQVDLRIYDLAGRLVRILVDGEISPPGRYEVGWDGKDRAGRSVAAGAYLCRLVTGHDTRTRGMMLVR